MVEDTAATEEAAVADEAAAEEVVAAVANLALQLGDSPEGVTAVDTEARTAATMLPDLCEAADEAVLQGIRNVFYICPLRIQIKPRNKS